MRGQVDDRPIRGVRSGAVVQQVPDVLPGRLDIPAVQRIGVGSEAPRQVLMGAVRQRGGLRDEVRVPVTRAHLGHRVCAQRHDGRVSVRERTGTQELENPLAVVDERALIDGQQRHEPDARDSLLLSRQPRRPSGSRWMCTGPTISAPRRIPCRRPPIT